MEGMLVQSMLEVFDALADDSIYAQVGGIDLAYPAQALKYFN